MLNIRYEIKVFGLRVKVRMPVLSMGYVICLKIFSPDLFTISQTGFLALALIL